MAIRQDTKIGGGWEKNPASQSPKTIVQQHTKEFDLQSLRDDQIQEQIGLFQNLLDQRRSVPQDAAAINDHLARLNQEFQRRAAEKSALGEENKIASILGSGGQTMEDFRMDDPRMRQALEDIFNVGRTSGETALNEVFAEDRGRAIDEAAASGMLRQPGFLTKGLRDVDQSRRNSLRDLFLGLEGERARGKLNLEDVLFNRAQTGLGNQRTYNLARAGLSQGGGQFQQSLGLEQNKFGEAKRRNTMEDIFGLNALETAGDVGRMQGEAGKPSTLDWISAIAPAVPVVGSAITTGVKGYKLSRGKKIQGVR